MSVYTIKNEIRGKYYKIDRYRDYDVYRLKTEYSNTGHPKYIGSNNPALYQVITGNSLDEIKNKIDTKS